MRDLSILIPSRNEQFIRETIDNILKNKRADTEVLVGLDGSFTDIPDHPDVKVVYVSESIGQRAMQNLLARLSTAKYVAKTDAHCAFSEGFDVELIKTFEELGEDITVAPLMKNLWVYDWKCMKCGSRWYQGPQPTRCMIRGKHTSDMEPNLDCDNTTDFKQKMVFKPRPDTPNSCSYRFDNMLHFQYWNEYKSRQNGDLVESLSLQGSFFMATRKNYWEKELCDESWGSWGNQGTEVALKNWLSGSRVIINKRCWYAHLFRTQPGFSFPYQQSGSAQQRARDICQDIFFNNKWEKQIYPLAWVIEKFKPIPDWHDGSKHGKEALDKVVNAAVSFTSKQSIAGLTPSASTSGGSSGELVSPDTVGAPSLDGAVTVPSKDISPMADESQVVGVDTTSVVADVVNDGNISSKVSPQGSDKPSIHNPVDSPLGTPKSNPSVSEVVAITSPLPAASEVVETNLTEKSLDEPRVETIDGEQVIIHSPHSIPQTKGILYFTDGQLPEKLANNVLDRLKAVGLPLEISLREEGEERGYETMFNQILRGLERMNTDFVFMAEHDVLYPKEHFDFTPPDKRFWYDQNWYKVHSDGLVVHWNADQVSGLVADRQELIKYYKYRIETFDKENFDRKFEPFSGEGSASWKAPVPHIDIRHNRNLTYNKRELKHFRKKETAVNFETTNIENIPHWDPDEIRQVLL